MISLIRAVVACIPVVLLGLVYVGDSFRKPHVTTPLFFGLLFAWAAAVWLLGRQQSSKSEPEPSAPKGLWARGSVAWWIRASALVAGGLLVILLSDSKYQGMLLYPKLEGTVRVLLIIAGACLAFLLARPPRVVISVGILVLAGVLVRACGLFQWEINPARRDMLALVISALDSFLAGDNPYAFHQMQVGSVVPLTYPPGLWLAHLPAHVAGLDIRWTGILADGIVALSLVLVSVRRNLSTVGPVFLAAAFYLFSPDVHWNGIYAEPNLDWAVLALLCAAAISERPILTGGLMGLALATRPFNLVLLPFLVIWLLRRHGLRAAWRSMIAAGLVAAAFYLPFVMRDPDVFFTGTVRWLLEYGQAHHKWFFGMLGCSGFFYKAGRADLLVPFQLGGVAVILAVAAWRMRTVRGLLVSWALAYAVFVAFNSIIWMSFWVGVCIIAAAGSGALGGRWEIGRAAQAPGKDARRALRLLLEVGLSAVVLVSAGILGVALHAHFSEKGRDEVVDHISGRASAGDEILDLTGRRVAFMKSPFILERKDLPRGAVLATDPFTAALPRRTDIPFGRNERVLVASRHGIFDEVRDLFLGSGDGPYEVVDEERVGSYRITELRPRWSGAVERLTDHPERLRVTAGTGKKSRDATWDGKTWRFPGARGWQTVGPKSERIGRIPRSLIWAHPWEVPLRLTATFEEPCRWISVVGGLKDRAPQWGRADVRVSVSTKDGEVGAAIIENRPGMQGRSFAIPEGAQEISFTVETEDTGRRQLLFDAVCFGAKDGLR